jgi:hypothetical protein
VLRARRPARPRAPPSLLQLVRRRLGARGPLSGRARGFLPLVLPGCRAGVDARAAAGCAFPLLPGVHAELAPPDALRGAAPSGACGLPGLSRRARSARSRRIGARARPIRSRRSRRATHERRAGRAEGALEAIRRARSGASGFRHAIHVGSRRPGHRPALSRRGGGPGDPGRPHGRLDLVGRRARAQRAAFRSPSGHGFRPPRPATSDATGDTRAGEHRAAAKSGRTARPCHRTERTARPAAPARARCLSRRTDAAPARSGASPRAACTRGSGGPRSRRARARAVTEGDVRAHGAQRQFAR